jgi:ribonuclease HII
MPITLKPSKALPKSERLRLAKLVEFESQARSTGYRWIAGVDEAGRGPLAGPVVAAACSIPEGVFFQGINDSKLLTAKIREKLFEQIVAREGVDYGIGIVEHTVIDQINIYQATLEAMRGAVRQLRIQPDYLLVDGLHLIVDGIAAMRIVNGDRRSQMIAAASVLAKVKRDHIMDTYHFDYPEYGFNTHKGYATEKHRCALAKFGPCPIHRRSFRTSFT